MGDRPKRAALSGKDQRVKIDEQMALVLVIGGDAGASGQGLADPRRRQILNPAADMDPRAERDVAAQEKIAGAQYRARVDQPLLGVERRALAQIGAVFRRHLRGDQIWVEGEPAVDRERGGIGGWA